jgi:hypothetical protein
MNALAASICRVFLIVIVGLRSTVLDFFVCQLNLGAVAPER